MKIILDCDPGHDDAIAIMLAGSCKEIEVLGITTEAGNQTVEKTTKNAINVSEFLGLHYPVYKGVAGPLMRTPLICPEIHGESGLDGVEFPDYGVKEQVLPGVYYLVDALKKNEHVTVVTTGAMTNLALALKLAPEIIEHIDKIVLMGGSMGAGNISPAAEFNILADAQAAHICFTCGAPVYMVGLDVTRQCLVTNDIVERMGKVDNDASKLFVGLMNFFNKTQKEVFGLEGGPLHDPLTIASLIDPELVTYKKMYVTVDYNDGPSYGRTNCDVTGNLKQPANVYVAVAVDVERYWDLIESCIRSYSC